MHGGTETADQPEKFRPETDRGGTQAAERENERILERPGIPGRAAQEAERKNEGILERRGGFGCAQADGEPSDERNAGGGEWHRKGGTGWLM